MAMKEIKHNFYDLEFNVEQQSFLLTSRRYLSTRLENIEEGVVVGNTKNNNANKPSVEVRANPPCSNICMSGYGVAYGVGFPGMVYIR